MIMLSLAAPTRLALPTNSVPFDLSRVRFDRSGWPRAKDELLVKLWFAEFPRLSSTKIARLIGGVSAHAVDQHARRTLGLPNRGADDSIRFWTKEKDALLADLRQRVPYVSEKVIAKTIGTTVKGTRRRALDLGLPPRPPHPELWWSFEGREAKLTQLWNVEEKSAQECADILGTERGAVCSKARRLGLRSRERPSAITRFPAHPDTLVAVAGLKESTCHWPIGNPDQAGFHFCGGRKTFGVPYCEHHAAIACRRAA